jgi:hypothetical protein
LGDASHLPFRDSSFDATICLHTLHLLSKQNGRIAVREMERASRSLVILAVPIDFIPEAFADCWKSLWKVNEFTEAGYHVELCGLRLLHRLALRKAGTLLSKLIFSMDPILNMFQKLLPHGKGHYMVCYKYLRMHKHLSTDRRI